MPVIRLQIKVKPQARRRALSPPGDDGLWHADLIALVADYFGCAKAKVTLVSGAGARIKRIEVMQS